MWQRPSGPGYGALMRWLRRLFGSSRAEAIAALARVQAKFNDFLAILETGISDVDPEFVADALAGALRVPRAVSTA